MNQTRNTQLYLAGALLLLMCSCVTRNADQPKPKPYPFDYCAVIKTPFDEEEGPKYGRIYDGYRVKFCCIPCTKAFDINPEAFMGPIRAFYGDTGTDGPSPPPSDTD